MKLLLCLTLLTQVSFAKEIKFAAFGDSITQAALANHNMGLNFIQQFTSPRPTDSKGWFTSIFDQPQYSWAMGDKILSIAEFLKSKLKINRGNFAVSGNTTAGLNDQVKRAKNKLSEIDISTILIGANNLCSNDSQINNIEKSKQTLKQTIDDLLTTTRTKVVLLDVPKIWELANFQNYRAMFNQTCKEYWEGFYCTRLMADLSPEHMAWVKSQVLEMNQAWAELAADYSQRYPDRFRYFPIFATKTLEPQFLSSDCFHPNIVGQKEIAKSFITKMEQDRANGDGFFEY